MWPFRTRHTWYVAAVRHGREVYIWGTTGGDVTVLLWRCRTCTARRTETIEGRWTATELFR